jgi:hypothetical protein
MPQKPAQAPLSCWAASRKPGRRGRCSRRPRARSSPPRRRRGGADEREAADAARGALAVRVLEHAVAVDLGGVEVAEDHAAAARLVGPEAAVVVLAAEHEADRGALALERETGPSEVAAGAGVEQGLEGLGGAVADRPRVVLVGEAPAAVGGLAVVVGAAGDVAAVLRGRQPGAGVAGDRVADGQRRALGERLQQEAGVPDVAAGPADAQALGRPPTPSTRGPAGRAAARGGAGRCGAARGRTAGR